MHSIDGCSPNADVRKCRAKCEIFVPGDTVPTVIDNDIVSANLIAEYTETAANDPLCELNITIDNSNNTFDVTDPNNIYSKLYKSAAVGQTLAYARLYLSTVSYNQADAYQSKRALQFDSISFAGDRVTLNFFDPFGFDAFDTDGMTTACNKTDGSPRAVVNYVLEDCRFAARCAISDDLNALVTLQESNFIKSGEYMTQRAGLRHIAKMLTGRAGYTVICVIDDDGNLAYIPQKNAANATETLTGGDYISFALQPTEEKKATLKGIFTDRGNIARELGDVVNLTNKGKEYTMRMFRMSYKYQNGMLSAENQGYIL